MQQNCHVQHTGLCNKQLYKSMYSFIGVPSIVEKMANRVDVTLDDIRSCDEAKGVMNNYVHITVM